MAGVAQVERGRTTARVPMYVAIGPLALFVLVNLLSYVVGLLTD